MAENMENKLQELANTIKTDDSFAAEVLDRIGSTPKTSRKINLNRKNLLGNFIMQSKTTKIAAAAVIIIAALIGINYFGGSIDGANVAFADVLKHVQRSSYTFDLTMSTKENGQFRTMGQTGRCSVLGNSRARFDDPKNGEISAVLDLQTGRCIIIHHRQKAVATLEEPEITAQKSGGLGIYGFLSKSVSNLWDLRDGTEKEIGKKKIAGRKAVGFRVTQKDAYFEYEIEIWADAENSEPLTVEITGKPLDNSQKTIKWDMANFIIGAELNKKDFSLTPPEGYVYANQKSLEEVKTEKKQSLQAQKLAKVLEYWSSGSKKEAIDTLLSVDWSAPMEFSSEQYIFTMTEKGYISLKINDQQKVLKKVMSDCGKIKIIVKEAIRLGQAEAKNKNFELAEKYYTAAQQFSKLLYRNPEGMLIVQLVGIGGEKHALKEMINLYTVTNDLSKLQKAKTQIDATEEAKEQVKRKAIGQ